MMKQCRWLTVAVLAVALIVGDTFAQTGILADRRENNFLPDPNEGETAGNFDFGNANFGGNNAGFGANEFGGQPGGFGNGNDNFGGGGFGAGAGPNIVTYINPFDQKVLTGERVQCRLTGKLLEDVFYIQVSAAEMSEMTPRPRDDGEWPDLVAGDSTFSNFTENNEYLSPEAHQVKIRVIRMLESAEQFNALEFYGTTVAANDQFSRLPYNEDEEAERDRKIREWADKFLKEFRRYPEDPESIEFWPMYVPRPPVPPREVQIPENFDALYFYRPAEEVELLTQAYQERTGQNQNGGDGRVRPENLDNSWFDSLNEGEMPSQGATTSYGRGGFGGAGLNN